MRSHRILRHSFAAQKINVNLTTVHQKVRVFQGERIMDGKESCRP